jgi:hypothetical protein
VAEDDELELRLKALREELMRHVEAAKNDAESVRNDIDHRLDKINSKINNLRFWVIVLISVFGIVAAILANAANLI